MIPACLGGSIPYLVTFGFGSWVSPVGVWFNFDHFQTDAASGKFGDYA